MVLLNDDLLQKLESALKTTMPTFIAFQGFLNLLDQDQIGFNYDDVNSPNASFEIGRRLYLQTLNQRGKMPYFLKSYFDQYLGNPVVKEFHVSLGKIYELLPANEIARLREEIFDCSLVQGDKLVFIDREDLKSYLFRLLKGEESRYLLINGEPGTGRSYTSYYLGKIAELTGQFKLVKINFDAIFKKVKGQIQMIHIARELIKIPGFNLAYSLATDEHFKYEEFYQDFLEFLGKSEEEYLFFFDQFDTAYSETVKAFINEFVNDVFNNLIEKHFIVLAGFDGAAEWDFELSATAGAIKTEPFNKGHLIAFIRKLYAFLNEKYDLEFSDDQLIELLQDGESFFRDDLFNPGVEPNVTVIGRGVHEWFFKKFKKEIEG
ncbi:MAG TPA: hypothetical protein PKE06_06180 [Flavilitoribacter sp.]|nr:hypothetical protein [Flavilitoribacter sp.]HMQ87990.1 hypothetical protein [Flavilitoribacter sp.]